MEMYTNYLLLDSSFELIKNRPVEELLEMYMAYFDIYYSVQYFLQTK